ncbi:SPASM domain-containing protein [Patescibacteria group bacterium]|nr:SPASM domain-containing protein [Patescibacteria group bacterium]MBU1449188.1 SPASM domain-containing protein [Patescibacteria group bacterium]
MIDIHFYQDFYKLKSGLMAGQRLEREELFNRLEQCRRREPVLYNLETTNACNMKCEMCPRTTMMTRQVETMDQETFELVVRQLRPWTQDEWSQWESFVQEAYGIAPDAVSENHFFLYIIPKVLVLHGYGDPLLDRQMGSRVSLLSELGIPTYFSCNPANISLDRVEEMFKAGLGYIKFSVESPDDTRHKEIRGPASDFTQSYRKIMELFERKAKHGYATKIVITMLNLNKPMQKDDFREVQKAFEGTGAYVYLKSQDQLWYNQTGAQTQSIHWIEPCQFPWSSMTIKSNGESVQCVEDFNNEIILGDVRSQSLADIWNGEAYNRFRWDHLLLTKGIKCTDQCDMKLIGEFTSDA